MWIWRTKINRYLSILVRLSVINEEIEHDEKVTLTQE